MFGMEFEWDDDKNQKNIVKHGISFKTAALVFADDNYLELFDEAHSDEEDRYIAIGLVNDILTVVHTYRGERIRIISSRRATENEKRLYYDRDI